MDGIKKTALFLSSLEFSAVDALLSRLDAGTARLVRREMLSIKHGSISEAASDKIDNDFLKKAGWSSDVQQQRSCSQLSSVPGNSAAKFRSTQSATYSAPKPKTMRHDIEAFVPADRPFGFLLDWHNNEIAAAVADEHPQTVAVVLAHLPQSRAKQILMILPPVLQNEVKAKLANYEAPSPIAVEEIESALFRRQPVSANGIDLRGAFVRLERLSDKDLSLIFHSVDLRTAVTALIGMSPEYIERVTNRFSPTEEHEMCQIVKRLGNVRQEDIDAAREKILMIASC